MSIVTKHKDNHLSVDLDRFRQKKKRKWVTILVGLVLAVAVWFAATLFIAYNRATTANTTGGSSILNGVGKKEKGTINVLLIGVGGASHPGGTLADTIMVASIDTTTSTISLVSIPRDLYVTLPGNGGKEKINAAHSYGETHWKTKGGGPAMLKQVVSDVTGVPIHYFVRIDFDGFKKIIDTLGGVSINVKTAISDPLFPASDMKNYDPFYLRAGVQTLNGSTALKYVRSRETTSDFDRARRQQEVLKAIKDKAISAQVLANPKKVTDLITVLGRHILSDFSASEGEQLLAIARNFDNPTVRSQVLDTSEGGLLTSTRNSAGSYILVPKAGTSDYSEVQAFIRAFFHAPAIHAEKPTITIQNGGVTKDQFARVAKYLEGAGFAVTKDSISSETSSKTTLEDFSADKTMSKKFLKEWLDLSLTTGLSSTPATDFVLILGPDFKKIVQAAEKKTVTSNESTESPLKASPTPEAEDSLSLGEGAYPRTSSTTLIP